jgi:enamine deaminase RidA (YjgF/YER057c/UK114 family)
MSEIEQRLAQLGIDLPPPMTPVGNYELVRVHGDLAYIAGHGPFEDGRPVVGRLGEDMDSEQGYQAARLTGLLILASLKQTLGTLDRVESWVRVVGYIHCVPGFNRNAEVLNGFSDLIIEVWGDAGRHVRSAPGQGPSPLGLPVIIDATAAVTAA